MKVIQEFREFISRGSVIDLAVGVIIGAALGKIVTSAVDQVIMPPIGLVTGGVDFSQLKIVLKAADPLAKQAEVAIHYGAFINTVIQFLIIAMVAFMLVKITNAVRRVAAARDKAAQPATATPSEALLMEIRDLLKAQAQPSAAPADTRRPPHQKRSASKTRS
jgi:large conductance mechanosensitive channel